MRAFVALALLVACAPLRPPDPAAASARAAEITVPGKLVPAAEHVPADPPPQRTAHLTQPSPWILDEEQPAQLELDVRGAPEGSRLDVRGLPPGASFDAAARTVTFTPDFTQGGWQSLVKVELSIPGHDVERVVFPLGIKDTIHPPDPIVVRKIEGPDATTWVLQQKTDAFLDSPGYAGRTFDARIVVPKSAGPQRRVPVHVELHGRDAGAADIVARPGFITVIPDDPMMSYWWGYAEGLPSSSSGPVRAYTQRRALHLLEWALRTFPGADPERVTVGGWSMGGAGALALAFLHPRHFAGVLARDAATIPRLHRAARIAQLSTLWGTPQENRDDGDGMGVWDRLDLTRVLRDDPQARELFVVTKHGKDDFVVRFDHAVGKSPLTGASFYESLARYAVARVVVWDEGGHGPPDPARGADWWQPAVAQLAEARRDRAQIAFVASSADANPGAGKGNGRRAWDADRGFAGAVDVSGDTGWDGDLAGGQGYGLLFHGASIVDAPARFAATLSTLGADALVDVVVRRGTGFRPAPGQIVRWRCGDRRGIATVQADGTYRLVEVPVTDQPAQLVVELSDLPALSQR